MAIQKKYQLLENLSVYPSQKSTIEVVPDDFGGAYHYRAQMCAGFENGETQYVKNTDTIQFVRKHADGTVIPGWQAEQLVMIIIDHVSKLNEKFPCEANIEQIDALNAYLEACRDRVKDRIERGVMGQLKE